MCTIGEVEVYAERTDVRTSDEVCSCSWIISSSVDDQFRMIYLTRCYLHQLARNYSLGHHRMTTNVRLFWTVKPSPTKNTSYPVVVGYYIIIIIIITIRLHKSCHGGGQGGGVVAIVPSNRPWDWRKSDEKCEHIVGAGEEYGRDWKSLTWLFVENSTTNVMICEE